MIIHTAEVSAKGKLFSGIVRLTLVKLEDGWTYEIDEMSDENLPLIWRAETPERASEKLKALYVEDVWNFKITS